MINDIFAHEDWLTTLMAAVGEPQIADKLKEGETVGGATYKVHLDGYDQRDLLAKGNGNGKRKEFIYWTDDGNVAALRFNRWKMVFMEQRAHGFDVWQDPFVVLRLPKLFDLRADPSAGSRSDRLSPVAHRSAFLIHRRRATLPSGCKPFRTSRRAKSRHVQPE